MTIDDAARLLHQELHRDGYSQSWEGCNPSERQRLRRAAEAVLRRAKTAAS